MFICYSFYYYITFIISHFFLEKKQQYNELNKRSIYKAIHATMDDVNHHTPVDKCADQTKDSLNNIETNLKTKHKNIDKKTSELENNEIEESKATTLVRRIVTNGTTNNSLSTKEKNGTEHNGRTSSSCSSSNTNENVDTQKENKVTTPSHNKNVAEDEIEVNCDEIIFEIQEEEEDGNNIDENETTGEYDNDTSTEGTTTTVPSTPTTTVITQNANCSINSSENPNLKGARKRKRGQKAKSAALESRESDGGGSVEVPQKGAPNPRQSATVDKMDNSLLTITEAIDAVTTLTEESEGDGDKEESVGVDEVVKSKLVNNTRIRRAAKRTAAKNLDGMIYVV